MSTTPQGARKAVFALIAARWAAGAPAIVTPAQAPEMRYQGLEKAGLPGATQYWARSSTQLATTRQSAHVTDYLCKSPVEFETRGVVFVQVFAPMTEPRSYARGELLAELAQQTFMASQTANGVWFRNPRIMELVPDKTWYRWNVMADYQFNQVASASYQELQDGIMAGLIIPDPTGDGLELIGNDIQVSIDELPQG